MEEGDRSEGDAIGERRPFHELQHQRAHTGGLFKAVDGPDVLMVQRREDLRLALEAGQAIVIARERVGQDLRAPRRGRASCRARATLHPCRRRR